MSGGGKSETLKQLGCGCRTEARGGEIHVYPCSAAHEPALTKAAKDLCEKAGVQFVERETHDGPT